MNNQLVVGADTNIIVRLLQNEAAISSTVEVFGQITGLRTGMLLIPPFRLNRSADPEFWEATIPRNVVMHNLLRDMENPYSPMIQEISQLRNLVMLQYNVGAPYHYVLNEKLPVIRWHS